MGKHELGRDRGGGGGGGGRSAQRRGNSCGIETSSVSGPKAQYGRVRLRFGGTEGGEKAGGKSFLVRRGDRCAAFRETAD